MHLHFIRLTKDLISFPLSNKEKKSRSPLAIIIPLAIKDPRS
jgi:hypothetical protein